MICSWQLAQIGHPELFFMPGSATSFEEGQNKVITA
jgi:hypothetical protein